jgi:hypothetical protein
LSDWHAAPSFSKKNYSMLVPFLGLEMPRKQKPAKLWIKRKKQTLIKSLGGKCTWCGRKRDLEFDHIYGTTWIVRDVAYTTRLRLYSEEIVQGLIQLLCRSCNASKGDPRRFEYQEPF